MRNQNYHPYARPGEHPPNQHPPVQPGRMREPPFREQLPHNLHHMHAPHPSLLSHPQPPYANDGPPDGGGPRGWRGQSNFSDRPPYMPAPLPPHGDGMGMGLRRFDRPPSPPRPPRPPSPPLPSLSREGSGNQGGQLAPLPVDHRGPPPPRGAPPEPRRESGWGGGDGRDGGRGSRDERSRRDSGGPVPPNLTRLADSAAHLTSLAGPSPAHRRLARRLQGAVPPGPDQPRHCLCTDPRS